MKTLSRLLLLVVIALAATFTLGASNETKKVSWKITGQLEEACSCAAACPCWFDSKPTRTTCGGNQVLFIQKGNYGNVKLDGLAIANYAQSPENQTMMDSFGKWNFSTNYIDENANPEQRKALEAIAAVVLPSNNGSKNFKTVDRKSTRLNSSHDSISYAVFCLKKKKDPFSAWEWAPDDRLFYRSPLASATASTRRSQGSAAVARQFRIRSPLRGGAWSSVSRQW